MLAEPSPESRSAWRNPLLYSSVVVLVAALAVSFIMFSRWQDARIRDRQETKERAEKQREQDRVAVEMLGGKEFSILDFYASPNVIHRGESAELCYGVSNAKNVKLEPPAQPVWPSGARCVSVSPTKTTTYTLTIEDAAGHSKSGTVELAVR